jgi:hypothetical protein
MTASSYSDIVIIGGGIAGLYSAYTIQKISPHISITILERYKKRWFGGRLGTEIFQGTPVVNGAGVGRKEKDTLLIHLLDELKIPYSEFKTGAHYSKKINFPCNLKHTMNKLRKIYKEQGSPRVTFKEFAVSVLGDDGYNQFSICSGYSDYQYEDAHDTLYHYGFDDNYETWTALEIPWKMLIDKLAHQVLKNKKTSILVSNKVDQIMPVNTGFIIHTEAGKVYHSRKLIVATTIDTVQQLVPGAKRANSIYQQIHSQPFLRVYGRFSKESLYLLDSVIKGYTVVPGPLYKIIPIDREKGIYMIAYCDNQGALFLKNHLENTAENREFFSRVIEKSLGLLPYTLHLIAIKDFYWKHGTHYYEPLNGDYKNRADFLRDVQHPMDNMLVVGEAVSMNQGWTEGALNSVEKVVTKKWLLSNLF